MYVSTYTVRPKSFRTDFLKIEDTKGRQLPFFVFKTKSIGIYTSFCAVLRFLKSCRKFLFLLKVKVKQYNNRPCVAQRVPAGLGSQIFMTFGT